VGGATFASPTTNNDTAMTGTEKQIAWATEILTRYKAAREVLLGKVAAAPEANRQIIMDCIAKIDAKINDEAHAGDIIARGQCYFSGPDHSKDAKGLQEAIGSIAKGHNTVLNA
jgi:hypothetical protein